MLFTKADRLHETIVEVELGYWFVHWPPLRAFSWALASRAARTRGDSWAKSTHSFMNSCYKIFVSISFGVIDEEAK